MHFKHIMILPEVKPYLNGIILCIVLCLFLLLNIMFLKFCYVSKKFFFSLLYIILYMTILQYIC